MSSYLLEKLKAGRKLRQIFAGSEMVEELSGIENALAVTLTDFTKMQQESTAGIVTQLAEYTAEAESLDRTLHYGAKALDGKTIEQYAERLARLRRSIEQLEIKQARAKVAQAELAEFAEKQDDIPGVWKSWGIEKQRRFVKLVTEKVVLTKPAPNWLQLEIVWLWPDEPQSLCYIWQRWGKGAAGWTEEENRALRLLYPDTDRATILATLPARSWSAITNQAHDLQIGRAYQFNNSSLHRLVSADDAAFMAQVGITLDDPYQRVWWINAAQYNEERSGPYSAR